MFDFIWYLLSPFTLISFPQSRDPNDDLDQLNNESINHRPTLKSVNIPYYIQGENEDSVVLQIKSLVYVFHRFKISNLKPFLKFNDITDEYDFDYLLSGSETQNKTSKNNSTNNKGILMNAKLDGIYNVDYFKTQLLNDPYRILVDYSKNKFRSLLILADYPNNLTDIPSLNTPNFYFLVLKPNDSIEKYIDIIINKSGIYSEHKINNKIKIKLLIKIIKRQRKHVFDSYNAIINSNGNNENNTNSNKTQPLNLDNVVLSKDDRAHIIRSYLQKLAFHIQVQRIYKAALKQKERDLKNKRYHFSTDKSIQSYKSIKSERSRMILLPDSPSSPVKNDTTNSINTNTNTAPTTNSNSNSNNSISLMDLDDTNNPDNTDHLYYSDAADSQASSSTSSLNFTKIFSPEEKQICFEESKMAVKIRIERERSMLLY